MTWGFDAKRALPAPTARRGSAAQPFSHVGTEFAAIGPRERRFRARWDTDLPSFGRRENGPVHVATHAGGDRRPAINCRIAKAGRVGRRLSRARRRARGRSRKRSAFHVRLCERSRRDGALGEMRATRRLGTPRSSGSSKARGCWRRGRGGASTRSPAHDFATRDAPSARSRLRAAR